MTIPATHPARDGRRPPTGALLPSRRGRLALALSLSFASAVFSPVAAATQDDMARFPAGTAVFPFRAKPTDSLSSLQVKTSAFRIDRRPVTTAEYLAFVQTHPRYARSRIPRLLANDSYLKNWKHDVEPGIPLGTPVTMISWHAAKAYCAARDKRLPTTAEWERVAATAAPGTRKDDHEQAILAWYARPASAGTPPPGTGTVHAHGVRDLHGVIWEWTSDYNAWSTAGVNSRGRIDEPDDALFCGAGSSRMIPGTPYATYMRWAFRASLKPDYTVAALGFRCARDD